MNATTVLPHQESAHSRVNATLGMVFFIGSWSMAFGALFLAFLILREKAGVWPPVGTQLPSFDVAALATGVLLASSAAVHLAVSRLKSGRTGAAGLWALGLGLGLVFAALQTWLWSDLLGRGVLPDDDQYTSLFFGLTWVHAAHVSLALLALLWMQVGLGLGRYGTHRRAAVQNAALFWHFMDIVWVLMFLAIFVF